MNESQRQRLQLMAERFSEWLEAINYSPKTRVNYTRDVKLFLAWLSENTAHQLHRRSDAGAVAAISNRAL